MTKSCLAALFAACVAAGAATAEPFSIVALGDAPYGEAAVVYPQYEALIETINARTPELVIHVGDTKSGSTPCSNEILDRQLQFMNSFAAPTLYTLGDNEWTDCHRDAAGKFDPVERLTYIRTTYFADPAKTFGETKADVASDAATGYPENARMMHKGVMFVTAHVVGSNNNFEVRDPAAVAEFFARDKANTDWLKASFAEAKAQNAAALVVAIQANLFEFDFNFQGSEGWLRHSGFLNFGETLKAEAVAFGKPVLLVYGDSHIYSSARPFPTKAPNVLALQVPGEDQMHAVEITIDPKTSGVFSDAFIRNPALATQ
jgi:hypothetical protein